VTAVSDTGQGISPDTLKNLFRPFKTTKKDGTGIGLCHTRTIVESHGGRIHVESRPVKGTKVEIVLPAN
ncbi:MAG TPA: ATP-binding protein, partial [Nitrospiraceae bacterium]